MQESTTPLHLPREKQCSQGVRVQLIPRDSAHDKDVHGGTRGESGNHITDFSREQEVLEGREVEGGRETQYKMWMKNT